MAESPAIGLATLFLLGVAAQWIAWRLGLPAILLLLAFGILAGPVTGLIDLGRQRNEPRTIQLSARIEF